MKFYNYIKQHAAAVFTLAAIFPTYSLNAAVIAYPEKGQSEKQQASDKSKCAQWATQQTGVNPETLLSQMQSTPQQPQSREGAVRGAGKGAAVGALGGAIGGDAGKGAAVGAGVGGAVGMHRKAKQSREAEQSQQQAKSQVQQQMDVYEKAEKTCLQGKGYSVS